MRTCSKCRTTKPLSEFYIRKTGKPVSACKVCVRERGKLRYATPEGRAKMAAYAKANGPRYQAQHRDAQLRANYGIDSAHYEAILAGQSGHCAICRAAPLPNKRLAVDHDHATGAVRGLLCSACNMTMGLVDRSPWWLSALQKYIDPC